VEEAEIWESVMRPESIPSILEQGASVRVKRIQEVMGDIRRELQKESTIKCFRSALSFCILR
jgi:hypothetical protein